MVEEYSVGELAQLVALASFPRPTTEADVELVHRRLRSWTLAGALPPIDDPHSGTGKHRRYDASAVYCALVLNVMADNDQTIGTLIAISRFIRSCLGPVPLFAGQVIERWEQAVAGTKEIFLVHIGGFWMPDSDSPGVAQDLVPGEELHHVLQAGAVAVNLTSLFARLPR